jgi:RimJ/RimL family protein N-acetyltransferase
MPVAGYFGTEGQRRLQTTSEAAEELIRATPGACQNCRMMGCDDIDRLGWDRIDEWLARDGCIGFRLIPVARLKELRENLAARGYRFDTWDVFVADRASGLEACEPILAAGLPDGFAEAEKPVDPEGEELARWQALMAAAGVVPFSGSMLAGAIRSASTVAILNRAGAPAAVAHTYMPHNAYSSHHRHAWGGLVAVADEHRGMGLGTAINARAVTTAFRQLGASHVYELVSATNVPSRRMVAACGLALDPEVFCGAAVPADAARYTR